MSFASDLYEALKGMDLVDVAPRGTARQSSYSRWSRGDDPQRALRDHGDDFAFHTEAEDAPWWELTLPRAMPVALIVVHNRRTPRFRALADTLRIDIRVDGRWRDIARTKGLAFEGLPEGLPLLLPLDGQTMVDGLRITSLRQAGYLHLSRIQVLCPRTFATQERPGPVFIARRRDGFGERLNAILNAMTLASKIGGTFRFEWKPKPGIKFHTVQPCDKTFAPDFIAAFHLDQAIKIPKDIPILQHVFNEIAASDRPFMGPIDVLQRHLAKQAAPLLKTYDLGAPQQSAFDAIRFTPELEFARALARKVSLQPGTTAFHLRAGDIVYGRYRFMDRYIGKVCPLPLAIRAIEDLRSAGKDVILFGQDGGLLDTLADRYGARQATSFAGNQTLTAEQFALFEICLMSRCANIVAGTSGFAVVANRISGAPLTDPYDLFAPNALVDILVSGPGLDDPAFSNLQKAFSYAAALFMAAKTLPIDERIAMADRILKLDPGNDFYRILRAVLLFRSAQPARGDAELLDLFRAPGNPEWNVFRIFTTPHPDRSVSVSPYLADFEDAAGQERPGAALAAAIAHRALGNATDARRFANLARHLAPEDAQALSKYLAA